MKDFFLFFPILIIVWLCHGVKYIYEIVAEKLTRHPAVRQGPMQGMNIE